MVCNKVISENIKLNKEKNQSNFNSIPVFSRAWDNCAIYFIYNVSTNNFCSSNNKVARNISIDCVLSQIYCYRMIKQNITISKIAYFLKLV